MVRFTVNSKSCTVSLTTGGDPVIALGKYTGPASGLPVENISQNKSSIVKVTSSNNSTPPPIVSVNLTKTNQTTLTQLITYKNMEYVLSALFAIMVLFGIYYYLKIRKKYGSDERKEPGTLPPTGNSQDNASNFALHDAERGNEATEKPTEHKRNLFWKPTKSERDRAPEKPKGNTSQ